MLCFGAIIYASIIRNRGNTPKGSAQPYVSNQEADEGIQEFRMSKNCTQTEGNKTKERRTAHYTANRQT